MTDQRVVLVQRDPRTRPRESWLGAWTAAEGHSLSTQSTWSYVRDTVTFGGWRATALPVLGCLLLTAIFLATGFAAAVIAASADSSRGQALLLLAASVLLSQVGTAVQNRRPIRRLFIVAAVRVTEPPTGWGIAWITVPSKRAAEARHALLTGAFRYVEITYYRARAHSRTRGVLQTR
jgi:hypothetical protein